MIKKLVIISFGMCINCVPLNAAKGAKGNAASDAGGNAKGDNSQGGDQSSQSAKTAPQTDVSIESQMEAYNISEKLVKQAISHLEGKLESKFKTLVIYTDKDQIQSQRLLYEATLGKLKKLGDKFEAARYAFNAKSNQPDVVAEAYVDQAKGGAGVLPNKITAERVAGADFQMKFLGSKSSLTFGAVSISDIPTTISAIVGLFKPQITLTPGSLTLDPDALSIQFYRGIRDDISSLNEVYVASLSSPAGFNECNKILSNEGIAEHAITDLKDQLSTAAKAEHWNEKESGLNSWEETIKAAIKKIDATDKIKGAAISLLDSEVRALRDCGVDLDEYITSAKSVEDLLEKADPNSNETILADLNKINPVVYFMDDPEATGLEIKVLAAGGTTKETKTALSFSADKMTYDAGVIFLYTLTDYEGRILYTNIAKGYVGDAKIDLLDKASLIPQDLGARDLGPKDKEPQKPGLFH